MSPKSVESYLFGLSKLQQLNGFQPIRLSKSILRFFLDGWINDHNKNNRKDQTFSIRDLEKLQSKFKKIFKHKVDAVVYTTAAVLAFFGSLRISEILAVSKEKFDKFSTLRWKDVKIEDKQVIIKIKKHKRSKKPEEVFLFNFKTKNICPVHCLKKLLRYQKK
jgi:integrase